MSDSDRIKLSYIEEASFGVTPEADAAEGTLTLDTQPQGEVAAEGVLTIAAQPSNGDTVTIGSKVYTFQTVLTDSDGNVEIAGSLAQTQLNLENAIKRTGTPGTGYAASTTEHPDVTIDPFGAVSADEAVVRAKVAGTAGNAIATTETFTSGLNFFDDTTLGTETLGVDPDTFTLGSKVYTLQNTLTDVDGNVQIGVNLAATQANIVAAINLTGVAGTQYAASQTVDPLVSISAFNADVATLTAKSAGTAGNSIVTTETFAAVTNVFDAATLGSVTAGTDVQLKELRMTSESLVQATNAISSAEIRPDRQLADLSRASINAEGDINSELSYGSYDDFFQYGLFADAWTSEINDTDTIYSMQASDNSLNRDSGDFIADGFTRYSWIRTSGFQNDANNGFFKIIGISAQKLLLEGTVPVVDEDEQGVAAQGTLTVDTQPVGAEASQGTLTVDTLPTDGDTFTIDSKTYTLQSTLVDADGNIQLAGTLIETQDNIYKAINLSGVAGVDYAASMTVHPTVTAPSAFAADDLVLQAKSNGVAGDSIVTTETFTAGTNIFDGATLGTTNAGVDGDTMVVDAKTYTFDANGFLEDIDGHIQVGVTLAATKVSIVAAFDLSGIGGTDYADSMTAHPTVDIAAFAGDDAVLTAKLAGTGGNTIVTTITATGGNTFDGATLGVTTPGSGNDDQVTIRQGSEITNGVTSQTMTIEKEFTDLSGAFSRYLGMLIDTMSLNVAAEAIITGAFSMLGKNEVSATATLGTTDALPAPAKSVMSAIDDVSSIREGGAEFGAITLAFSLANQLRTRPLIAVLGSSSIGAGTVAITGTLTAYFENKGLIDKYLNFENSSLGFVAEDGEGNAYVFDFPKVKYNQGQRVAGGQNQDVIADMAFTAVREPCENITIRIVRFPAAAGVDPCADPLAP